MDERLLMEYLAQRISAAMLNRQAAAQPDASELEFELFPRHLVQLCDAVLGGDIAPTELQPISRCLYYSGSFRWPQSHPDGRVVEEILTCWLSLSERQAPGYREVVYYRQWLLRGRPPETADRDD